MLWSIELILLSFAVVFAVLSLWVKDLMNVVVIFGAYSFLMCLVWTGMGAVDVAFTEVAVGAGVSTMFLVAVVYNTTRAVPEKKSKGITATAAWAAIASVLTGLCLFLTMFDFPSWGDPDSPVNTNAAAHYLTHSLEDTGVPNVVTTVLADYRGYDTMFETTVVFIVLVVLMGLSKHRKPEDKAPLLAPINPPHVLVDSLIIKNAIRIIVPIMQLFGLYVLAHGHNSPGGGFQGGVILGASLILISMGYDFKTALGYLSERIMFILAALGVFIYSGIGLVPVLLGRPFLDYSAWNLVFPFVSEVMARYYGILGVEIGVALTVMSSMFGIYLYLSSHGDLKRGL